MQILVLPHANAIKLHPSLFLRMCCTLRRPAALMPGISIPCSQIFKEKDQQSFHWSVKIFGCSSMINAVNAALLSYFPTFETCRHCPTMRNVKLCCWMFISPCCCRSLLILRASPSMLSDVRPYECANASAVRHHALLYPAFKAR